MLSERARLVVGRIADREHPLPGLGGEHQRMAVGGGLVGQDAFAHFGFAHLGDALGQRQVGQLAVARIEDERVAGQFEADHQADGPREDLRGHVPAGGVGLLDQVETVDVERVARVADRQRERHREADVRRDVEHHLQRRSVVSGDEVGDELDQPAARILDAAGDRLDLVATGVETRYGLATFALVQRQPRRGEAERADRDGLGGERAHLGQVLGVAASRSTPRWPIT